MKWKRVNEMRIATWNVGTLYTAGKMNELIKELDKYKIVICVCKKLDGQGKEL
jgi:hypothetical protein